MNLTFGARLNTQDADHIGKLEEWGYESVWSGEHILFYGPTSEALTVLAYYAGRTKRLRLGTSIYLLPLRHPTVVAKTVTTLDILSGGRVTLGIGVGGEYPKEFEATGVPVNERGSRTNESIVVMKRLWTESNVTHEGKHYKFTDVTMEPRPVQKPHPPIVVAGRSEAAQRRAGRLGNGYMPYLFSAERYRKGVEVVRQAAKDVGRDLDAEEFSWSVYLFTATAKTKDDARRIAARRLGLRYRQPFQDIVDRVAVVGPPDECAAQIARFVEAGAREIIISPLLEHDSASLEYLELYARDILPKVRSAVTG